MTLRNPKATQLLGAALLFALVSLSPASGQNASPAYVEPANLAALVAAAAKDGTLTLGASDTFGGSKGAQLLQQHIAQKYHITFEIHYSPVGSGGAFLRQLAQEVRAGQTASSDIVFTANDRSLPPVMQRVDWHKYVPDLPANAVVYDSRAVKLMTELVGFSYNTKLIAPNDVPHSFADLLKPQWKGKIATSPYQGTFMAVLGLPSAFGPQRLLEFAKRFNEQVGGIMTCGDVDRIVAGEFLIFGLDCGDHEVRLRQRKGESIASIYPREATEVNYISPGIPLTAAHPAAARLFITYLLTREGQNDLWDLSGQDSDLMPGSHMAKVEADLRRTHVNIGVGTRRIHPLAPIALRGNMQVQGAAA
jgi:ABC-type Fe3+ transport system substrate-binding protein